MVCKTCDFGPPILKIAYLVPQVSPPLQKLGPSLILTNQSWYDIVFYNKNVNYDYFNPLGFKIINNIFKLQNLNKN